MTEHLLFVYGSLRRGHHNHSRLQGAMFLGNFSTVDRFTMFGLRSRAYPYAFADKDGVPVVGELYSVSTETIEFLDRMEGHPTVYCRTPLLLEGWGGTAEMYVLVEPQIKKTLQNYGTLSRRFVLIPSGDWTDFTGIQPMQTNAQPSSTRQ